jgi:lipopolysaccharide biosynthesis regulator YciM
LDRAERLFLDLIELKGDVVNSLNSLINIYQQQKDWQQAIATAKKLEYSIKINMSNAIAHYYCELAEQSRQHHRNKQAKGYLKEALNHDKYCARANIILGKILVEEKDHKNAINAFKRVYDQDAEYISEVIVLLEECYKQLNIEEEFVSYLTTCISENPRIYFVLAMVDQLRDRNGDQAAIEYLSKQTHRCLSMRGLERILDLYINNTDADLKAQLIMLKEFIDKLLENKPVYRCIHCGFSGKKLYWQCPRCKRWNSIKPIHGIEGD